MGHMFDSWQHTRGPCESRDQKEEFYEGGNLCFWDAEAATNTRAERFVCKYRPMVWQTRGRLANART